MRQFSGSFFKGVVSFITIIFVTWPSFASASFVDQCLGETGILRKALTCEGNGLEFQLNKGTQINLSKRGLSGQAFAVRKIKHLPPRIESLGMMDESVQFIATDGRATATINIPCGQSQIAYVGYSANAAVMPNETITECR